MNQIKNIYCLAPVFNDWESFSILIDNIKSLQKKHSDQYIFSIISINDGSTEEVAITSSESEMEILVLNLKVNIGHQRAIAVGLQ
jgi:hypothetical protein